MGFTDRSDRRLWLFVMSKYLLGLDSIKLFDLSIVFSRFIPQDNLRSFLFLDVRVFLSAFSFPDVDLLLLKNA